MADDSLHDCQCGAHSDSGLAWQLAGDHNLFLLSLLLIFVGSSILCSLAWSGSTLILFQVLQGIGRGPITPMVMVFLAAVFPAQQRGLAMGLYGMASAFGPTVGPVLAGYVTEHVSWRMVFYINVVPGLVCIALVLLVIPRPARRLGPLLTSYAAMGIDQGELGSRRYLLLWWCEDFHEKLEQAKGVLRVDIERLAAIIGHELERVDAKVCLHAGPKEVTRNNRINEAKGLQVGSRQEGAVNRLSHARRRDASACGNDLLNGLVGRLDEVCEHLVNLGRHGAAAGRGDDHDG